MSRTFVPVLLLSLGPALGVTPGVARGDEIDGMGGDVLKIESEIRDLDIKIQPAAKPSPEVADRRLIDAQVLYELKNYEAASIILLDVVEKYQDSQAFPEALFFLADALFLKRDFFSSRRYFEKTVELGPAARRYQEALQRLVELSLYTGDYGPVDGYLAKLAVLPPVRQLPSVPYVKGKYYYFRQKYDAADASFKDIGPGHIYWFHSQYFVGAGQVARGKLVDAINTYESILKAEAKTDSQKRISELSHLALGRIYYDRGQLTNAFTEYSKISQKSDLFPDALYEQAWVSIKSKEYKKAYRALDLLLTAKPDDPLAPEVKLLIGNLHVRQNEWNEATDSFTRTRDEFEPIKKQMETSVKGDASGFFKELIGKNLGKFDTSTYLPPLAVKWVKAEPDMERVVNLSTDVGDLKKSLDEAEEIVRRLERALSGPQRINVFPELAQARANVLELSAHLGGVERKLIIGEKALWGPVATESERAQLDQLAAQRAQLERQIGTAATDDESQKARQHKIRAEFDAVDKRATELNVILESMRAIRTATGVYLKSIRKDSKLNNEQVERELEGFRLEEEDLRRQYETLRRDISDTAGSVGVFDLDMQQQEVLRQQLSGVIAQEHDLGGAIRARLSGETRTRADQLASILDRARSSERSLRSFDTRIDEAVDARLKDVRSALADEKAQVASYRQTLGGYEGDTVDVGSGVTADNFRMIAERFYGIVVRADVGIIDVAWALKQTKTDENDRLLREQKRELKLLDDEFKQVLKE